MEFPETGEHCSVKNCKILDFLPIHCQHCKGVFCKEHFHMTSHECLRIEGAIQAPLKKSVNYSCSKESCKEVSPVNMPCGKCKLHFCLAHRHHGCWTDEKEVTQKLKKWQLPKKQFAEAKAVVDQEVSENLKKSKNTALANKVQLMRVKGSAVGPKTVPMSDRRYFHVHLPLTVKNQHIGTSKGVFVNVHWTIGKCIDSIADTLKVPNNNNIASATKLQLYHHSSGELICSEMETLFSKLIDDSVIVDGQKVILEYSDIVLLDTSLYK